MTRRWEPPEEVLIVLGSEARSIEGTPGGVGGRISENNVHISRLNTRSNGGSRPELEKETLGAGGVSSEPQFDKFKVSIKYTFNKGRKTQSLLLWKSQITDVRLIHC